MHLGKANSNFESFLGELIQPSSDAPPPCSPCRKHVCDTHLRAVLQPAGVADEGGVGHPPPELLAADDAVGEGRPREDVCGPGVGGAGDEDEARGLGHLGVLGDHLAQRPEALLQHLGLPGRDNCSRPSWSSLRRPY